MRSLRTLRHEVEILSNNECITALSDTSVGNCKWLDTMVALSLKICVRQCNVVKTMQFEPSTAVYDACRVIRERVPEAQMGQGEFLKNKQTDFCFNFFTAYSFSIYLLGWRVCVFVWVRLWMKGKDF